jgi:hypothetical protein
MMRAEGWAWEHEVRVWLPPTDNALEIALGGVVASESGLAPEVIIVSVGAPRGTDTSEFGMRRGYDFIPGPSGNPAGFLDFLVNTVRPELAAEYLMSQQQGDSTQREEP